MLDLHDLTRGNYTLHRELTYPEFPNSRLVFDTEVTAVRDTEWTTKIGISGTYDGPTDVVAVKDYRLDWTADGKTITEKGSATLELSSGKSLNSTWTSTITPAKPDFARFPRGGQTMNLTFSRFKIDGNKMSYEWKGTGQAATEQR